MISTVYGKGSCLVFLGFTQKAQRDKGAKLKTHLNSENSACAAFAAKSISKGKNPYFCGRQSFQPKVQLNRG
jgi:hypothetical protein